MPHNNALQRTFAAKEIFDADMKVGVAANAAELKRWADKT